MDAMTFEFRFLLAALTLFRLAELFTVDDGPNDIFLKARQSWAMHYPKLKQLAVCPYCMAIWLAPILLVLVLNPIGDALLVLGGLVGLQSFLESIGGRT